MKVTRYLKEAEEIPKGYALRRICIDRLGYEVAIIPFNFVLRAWDWFYRKINQVTRHDKLLLEEYTRATQAGYEAGDSRYKKEMERNMKAITEELKQLGILVKLGKETKK